MSKLYNPATGGFYDTAISYPSLPSGLVPVSDALYASLMAAQAAGQMIQAGTAGVPEAVARTAPTLTNAQQAQIAFTNLLAGGLAITSTATPALNDTYLVNATTQPDLMAEAQYYQTFGTFTNGTTTIAWPNLAETAMHSFTWANFQNFVKACGAFLGAAKVALNTAISGSTTFVAPGSSATIP